MPEPVGVPIGVEEQQQAGDTGAAAPAAPSPSGEAIQLERRRMGRLQAMSQVIIATAVVLTLCYVAKLVLVVVLVSILIAFVLAPIVDLLHRLYLPRGLGSLIAVCILLASVYGVVYFSYNRAVEFIHDWPKYSGQIRKIVVHVRQQAASLQKTTEEVLPETKEEKGAVRVRAASPWTDLVSRSFGSVTETVLILTFIPFLVYFMLTWQEHVRSQTVMLFRIQNRNTAYVTLGLISAMLRSFMVGNFIVGLFMSAVSVVVFALLHIPYFYFVGFLSGFLSLVPYLGVVLATLPPLLTGLGQIHSTSIVAILITVFGLHLFAINVLYPKFIGSRLQLNPLAVTLALLYWGWLWGAMGLILAIPLTAAMKIIFDHVESLRAYGAWLGE